MQGSFNGEGDFSGFASSCLRSPPKQLRMNAQRTGHRRQAAAPVTLLSY